MYKEHRTLFLLGNEVKKNTAFYQEELKNPGLFLPLWCQPSLKGKAAPGLNCLKGTGHL